MPVPGRDVRFHAKGQARPDDRPRTCKTIAAVNRNNTAPRSMMPVPLPRCMPHSIRALPLWTQLTVTHPEEPRSCWGVALKGQPHDGIDILTKVYWPTGPGPNERGLSRKNIVNAVESSLRRRVTSRVSMVDESR